MQCDIGDPVLLQKKKNHLYSRSKEIKFQPKSSPQGYVILGKSFSLSGFTFSKLGIKSSSPHYNIVK